VCAGVQQLNDRIRQVLKSSGSTTFSKIVNKWNGHRSPSPYMQTSQSIPTFGIKTYGYGGSHPRPPSPSKSWTSQSQSYTSGTPSHSFLSLSPCSNTTETDSRLESPHVSSETPTYFLTHASLSSYHFLTHAAFTLLLPLRLICH
jgi:hypothetical protein